MLLHQITVYHWLKLGSIATSHVIYKRQLTRILDIKGVHELGQWTLVTYPTQYGEKYAWFSGLAINKTHRFLKQRSQIGVIGYEPLWSLLWIVYSALMNWYHKNGIFYPKCCKTNQSNKQKLEIHLSTTSFNWIIEQQIRRWDYGVPSSFRCLRLFLVSWSTLCKPQSRLWTAWITNEHIMCGLSGPITNW